MANYSLSYVDAYAILAVDPVVGCNLCSTKSFIPTYLLRVELRVFAYIVTDDCNPDMLSAEHQI